ncbi:MAG: hypothetical protein NTZ68_04560, partial [Candidatus Dependentiae bacterium]|nr:hypothetical protein [Candidatus Dependentiae bacterium]
MKKQILKVLLLCSFLASVSVQASFDYDTGDGSEIFKPTVENREEVAAREMAKRENDAKRQEVKQLEYTKEQRKIAAAKAEAVIRKESKGGTVSFDRDNQDSRYNQLRREFLKEGEPSEGTVVSKGEVVSKGVPLQRGKPFN